MEALKDHLCEFHGCQNEATMIVIELYENGEPPVLDDVFILLVCEDHRPTCVGGEPNQVWNEARRHIVRPLKTVLGDPNDATMFFKYHKDEKDLGLVELYETMSSHLPDDGVPVYFGDKMWLTKDGRFISDEDYSKGDW